MKPIPRRRPAKATHPDPILAAWDRYLAANKAYNAADNAHDTAAGKARNKGFQINPPSMTVGAWHCLSVDDVKRAAREADFSRSRQRELIGVMKKRLAEQRRQRKAAGLTSYDRAVERAAQRYHTAMKALATTHATTPAGIILKLRFIAESLTDADGLYEAPIMNSAIADLSRLGLAEGFRDMIRAKRK
jgi:hypothetical protein